MLLSLITNEQKKKIMYKAIFLRQELDTCYCDYKHSVKGQRCETNCDLLSRPLFTDNDEEVSLFLVELSPLTLYVILLMRLDKEH